MLYQLSVNQIKRRHGTQTLHAPRSIEAMDPKNAKNEIKFLCANTIYYFDKRTHELVHNIEHL